MLVFSLFATSLAFAGHDHGGGTSSGGQASAPSPADQQASQTAGQLLKNCSEQVESIQRHIYRLQAKIAEKRAASSVNVELEALEQKLIEAKEIVRSLQIY
jgi:hypothetical protein